MPTRSEEGECFNQGVGEWRTRREERREEHEKGGEGKKRGGGEREGGREGQGHSCDKEGSLRDVGGYTGKAK